MSFKNWNDKHTVPRTTRFFPIICHKFTAYINNWYKWYTITLHIPSNELLNPCLLECTMKKSKQFNRFEIKIKDYTRTSNKVIT